MTATYVDTFIYSVTYVTEKLLYSIKEIIVKSGLVHRRTGFVTVKALFYCSAGLHPASGSNLVIAVAVSVVAFPKSFWSTTPSWSIMKVITPELLYSAG